MADPTTSAIQGIADILADRIEAEQVVAGFTAHFEHRDGLRRVVLTGEWEVDPVAVRNTAAALLIS